MPNKHRKLIVVMMLFCGLCLCLLGGTGVTSMLLQKVSSCYNDRAPIKRMLVAIDKDERDQLIEQLRSFATKNGFAFKLSVSTPTGEDFNVWMSRKDLEIIATNPNDPETFKIGFYNNDCVHPKGSADIDDLINDLKNSIHEIPNVTISDEK